MEDKNMNCTNEAVKKIIDNITAEVPNSDGQYVPLVFPSPPANVENINWTQQPNYINHVRPGIEQYQKQQFGFMPQANPHVFDYQNNFEEPDTFNGILEPGLYENKDAFSPIYNRDYRLLLPPQQDHPQPEAIPQVQNSTLIEHLVGNWMAPNTTGTYSPFGTTAYYKPKVFETERDLNLNQLTDDKFKPAEEDVHFHFNRDSRKPRIVAEVKPMRPSYSDVLAKSVPQTSSTKIPKSDLKESKPKKENKSGKDKEKKINATLNRTNTNIEIKDAPIEKNSNTKMEYSKTSHLSRKWASMDNIANSNGQKTEEPKKKKPEEKPALKTPKQEVPKKFNKMVNVADLENETSKYENVNITKNGIKKVNKPCIRPKSNDSLGNNERPPGKRNQRTRKKENHVPFGIFGQKFKQYMKGWWKILTAFVFWLIHLISDICSLSLHIIRDMYV